MGVGVEVAVVTELERVLVLVNVDDIVFGIEDNELNDELDDEVDSKAVLDVAGSVLEVKVVVWLEPRLAPEVVTLGMAEVGVNSTPVYTICKCTSEGCPAKVVSTVVAKLEAPQPY